MSSTECQKFSIISFLKCVKYSKYACGSKETIQKVFLNFILAIKIFQSIPTFLSSKQKAVQVQVFERDRKIV